MVRSIVEALAEYAKVQPDKLFLADGKVELTYLDAWKCVYGYAVHLRELGRNAQRKSESTGFIDQIDCLIWQETVGNITMRKR